MDELIAVILDKLGYQGAFLIALAGYLLKKELFWQKDRKEKDASWQKERKEWVERLIQKNDVDVLRNENAALKEQITMLKAHIASKKRWWSLG